MINSPRGSGWLKISVNQCGNMDGVAARRAETARAAQSSHPMIPPAYSLSQVATHTLVIYAFLMAALRLVARRQLGQLTAIDLVIIVSLGSAVETAMIAGNTSLVAGLVSATTLLVTNRILSRIVLRWRRLRRFVIGSPLLLV